jgi:hypothetical protein
MYYTERRSMCCMEFFDQHNEYLRFIKCPTAVKANNEIKETGLKFFCG